MKDQAVVIGVDPGRTTGLCVLVVADGVITDVDLAQLSAGLVTSMIGGLALPIRALAVEDFVVGSRAARSADARAGAIARRLVEQMRAWGRMTSVPVLVRPAAAVKPWATDKRLAAAGITAPKGTGHRHALDGGRHALFTAVHDCGVPDPLSRASRSPR